MTRGENGEEARPWMRRARTISPEHAFAALSLCFGVAFALLTPPFDAPDERRHFARAVLISEGHPWVPGRAPGHGATLAKDLLTLHPRTGKRCQHDLRDLSGRFSLDRSGADDRRVSVAAVSTLFSPLPYLHQSAVIAVGRALGASSETLLVLGRLANVALWTGLVGWAIRLAPRRKWALVALGAIPMSIFLAGSLTADVATISIAFLYIAMVMRYANGTGESDRDPPRALPLLLGATLLGLAKPGYWPLILLLLIIPRERFANGRQRALLVASSAALAVVLPVAWLVISRAADPQPLGPEADPMAQLQSVARAPWHFAWIAVVTIFYQWIPWLAGFVGVLGRLNAPLPTPLYFAYPAALVALCWFDADSAEARGEAVRRERSGLLVVFALATFTLLFLSFVGWNPVGALVIADVHGRYFLPLAPLLLFALPAGRLAPQSRPVWVVCFCAVSLLSGVVAVIQRFYLP